MIPPGTDLLSLNEELLNAGVAGLYRPEVDRLYVRLFGSFSALEEATASHEYAHYLQDAGYDLERMFEVVAGNRDAELALRVLVEGDAFYVQQQYIAEHFNAVQLFGMSFGGILAAAEAPSIPYALTRQTTFVYPTDNAGSTSCRPTATNAPSSTRTRRAPRARSSTRRPTRASTTTFASTSTSP